MQGSDHLFVYGTLLAGAEHPMGTLLRGHARYVNHGTIRARLYIIDDPDEPGQNRYPGAVPSGNPADRVHGEVYALDDAETVLAAFDDYEACSPRWPEPHEFLRRRVTVEMAEGGRCQAISYLYTWDVSGARHVASGRFDQIAPDVR